MTIASNVCCRKVWPRVGSATAPARAAALTVRDSPPERQLLLPTLRGLLRLGWATQMTSAGVEIPWHQKRIDLAFMQGDDVVAIELKVDKWRKAVDQAFVNRWAAERSWVAI